MNWKVRLRNPVFWVQIVVSAFAAVLAYAGLTAAGLQIGGKRHVGRHHEINFQVCGLGLLQDGLDALQPGHHN